MTTVFPVIFIAALFVFTLLMAITDTVWRKIPNKFTVPFAILGLIFSTALWGVCLGAPDLALKEPVKELAKLGGGNFDVMFTYLSLINPLWAIAGFFLGFFILFLPAAFGGVGFGDVKLLAALGIWLGIKWFLLIFVMAILLACVLSVCVLLTQGPMRMIRKLRSMQKIGAEPQSKKSKNKKRRHRDNPRELKRIIPFAIPVAISAWLFLILFVTNTFQNVPVFYH